jgi:uncharacterized protein (TIGR00251 family)
VESLGSRVERLESEPASSPIQQLADGVRLCLKVLPRSSRTEVVGVQGDMLRIRVASAPVDGVADAALLRFLAERVSVPRSAVRIASGERGRTKVVLIAGVSAEHVCLRLGLSDVPSTLYPEP